MQHWARTGGSLFATLPGAEAMFTGTVNQQSKKSVLQS